MKLSSNIDELTSLRKVVIETLLPVASYLVPCVFVTPNTIAFFTSFPLTFTLGSVGKLFLLPLSSLLSPSLKCTSILPSYELSSSRILHFPDIFTIKPYLTYIGIFILSSFILGTHFISFIITHYLLLFYL